MSEKYLFIKQSPEAYVMFLPPDMVGLKNFRNELCKSLIENNFNDNDIIKIELAADEALTNSIAANVNNQSEECIICRWRIKKKKFVLYILDYGKGFGKNKENLQKTKNVENEKKDLNQYIESINKHQLNVHNFLPFEGIKKLHKNLGKGLKIIQSLMDTVKITYHSNDDISDEIEEDKIEGSILQIHFDSDKSG